MRSNVKPTDPIDEQPVIGLIGMGEMGRMYARYFISAGWKKINVCDRPDKFDQLKRDYEGVDGITVLADGHRVARASDFIIYSVEAEFIGRVVAEYGPSTKVGSIVAGQTSVKAPERDAFEKYLPEDVYIVSCHSLHGPTVSPVGQPLVLIKHRAPDWALTFVENVLRPFGSNYIYMSYEEHDLVTANTQAVTHAAFLSMGTAWASEQTYPWEHGYYVGGIETVKVNICLRIYSNKWHVYAGLAILNPSARVQIDQFARSTTQLYKLMVRGDEDALRKRMYEARDRVFPRDGDGEQILLSEDLLDRFSMKPPQGSDGASQGITTDSKGTANSHLSLLAMVDCWAALSIQPHLHLSLAATPIFRLWIGVAEYLFRSPTRLDAAIRASLNAVAFRSNDLEFVIAARGWSQCVSFGSFELYEERFRQTAGFFESRFEEATKLGTEMIKVILDNPGKGKKV